MKKLLLLLFIIGAGCSRQQLAVIRPHQGSIQATFTEQARTQLANIYDINMPLSGDVERIACQPGDTVKKGQALIKLVKTPWIALEKKASAALDNVKVRHEQQRRNFKRTKKLSQTGFTTSSDLEQSQTHKEALKGEYRQAKADLVLARYQVQQATIHSPVDGIVLKRFTQGKKWLAIGAPLLQLGNLDELEAVADILTQQAQQLHVGDPVLLTSHDMSAIKGVITRIHPAGFTKQSALGVDEQRVSVIIKLVDVKGAHLGVDYRLHAEFRVGTQNKNALLVPRFSVLQDEEGQFYVLIVQKNKLEKRIVNIGITTDQTLEIQEGLALEEEIVAQPTADMFEGMKL